MAADRLPLGVDLAYLDELYARFLTDPSSVDPSWGAVFANGAQAVAEPAPVPVPVPVPVPAPVSVPGAAPTAARFGRVWGLVNAYRSRGHLAAELDPLGATQRAPHPELDPRTFGFSDGDMDQLVPNGGFYGIGDAPLREIHRRLEVTY